MEYGHCARCGGKKRNGMVQTTLQARTAQSAAHLHSARAALEHRRRRAEGLLPQPCVLVAKPSPLLASVRRNLDGPRGIHRATAAQMH